MEKFWFVKCTKFLIFSLFAIVVLGYIVMWLWNWLLPDLINASEINFFQSVGILVLSKILFGGLGKFGGKHRRHHWKHEMKEKYRNMSPEDREKFREKFRYYCRHRDCSDE